MVYHKRGHDDIESTLQITVTDRIELLSVIGGKFIRGDIRIPFDKT